MKNLSKYLLLLLFAVGSGSLLFGFQKGIRLGLFSVLFSLIIQYLFRTDSGTSRE